MNNCVSATLDLKRRRLRTMDPLEAESTKAKFTAVKEKFGRDLHLFETFQASKSAIPVPDSEVPDEFYEFTAEDAYRASKTPDLRFKGRKIREAELAARRAKITKAMIRVRFPDNLTLEVRFDPYETIQSLLDFLNKVVARPELKFYLYTVPPKKRLKDLSQDFHTAGFVPGAIVYFSYDLPEGEDLAVANLGPFLCEEIMSLKNLETAAEVITEPAQSETAPVTEEALPSVTTQEQKPVKKKPNPEKWLKLSKK